MKRVIFCVILAGLFMGAAAQQKISGGLMYNPQGKFMVKEADKGFSLINPLYALVTIETGKTSWSPMYCLNDNSIGAFVEHPLGRGFGSYIVAAKSLMNSSSYLGFGIGIKADNGYGIFLEGGSALRQWEPQIYFGVSIPFIKTLWKK